MNENLREFHLEANSRIYGLAYEAYRAGMADLNSIRNPSNEDTYGFLYEVNERINEQLAEVYKVGFNKGWQTCRQLEGEEVTR